MTDYISQWCEEYEISASLDYEPMTDTLGLCYCYPGYCRIVVNCKLKDRFTEEETQWHEFSHALAWLRDGKRGHGEPFDTYYRMRFPPLKSAIYRFISSLIVDFT